MSKEILERLVYVEETFAGELEKWEDPLTNKTYLVPIEVTRDFDNIQEI